MKTLKPKSGFTIIETALTIAVGGLIFLMIFVALPALRTQQRDTARRENVLAFIERIKNYQSNNRGSLPIAQDSFYQPTTRSTLYFWEDSMAADNYGSADGWDELLYHTDEAFVDPDGIHYNFVLMRCGRASDVECDIGGQQTFSGANITTNKPNDAEFPNGYSMYVVLQAKCSGDKAVGVSNPRKVAILYKLEGAGVYCANT